MPFERRLFFSISGVSAFELAFGELPSAILSARGTKVLLHE